MSTKRPDPRQEGLSLVELMVAMTIAAVLLSGLTAFFIGSIRAAGRVDTQTTDQGNARIAMSVLSRDIRAAVSPRPSVRDPIFEVALPNEAHFYAAVGDGQRPIFVRMYIDADSRLVEDATPPASGTLDGANLTWDPDNDAEIRYIASFVVNDAAEPLFRYYRVDAGQLIEMVPDTANPTGLTLVQRQQIAAVELNVAIGSDPSQRTSRFLIRNVVRLPNALSSI